MRKLGRRQFLLGLGAGSALAALHPLRLGAALAPEAGPQRLRALNVLIHGMLVVDVGTRQVILYPPKTAGHAYKAGDRGAEQDLVEGAHYRLTGVKPHARLTLAEMHPGGFGVFHRHPVNTRLAYCEVILPMPDSITPLRATTKAQGQPFFEGTPNPYEAPDSLPDVLVLTYNEVEGPVKLTQLSWTPKPNNGIANLNFWAMPSGPVPPDHPEQAFADLAKLIRYPHLKINPYYTHVPPPPLDAHTGVPGVTPDDERGLTEGGVHIYLSTGSLTCAAYGLY